MLTRIAAAGVLVLCGVFTNMFTAVAHADDVVVRDANGVPWSWSTEASCIKDGPDQHLANNADDAFLKYWYCLQHDDGLWYLHNTDSPSERVG
ncbi:hypothetical protein [Mycobacteroides abscessus]|uniref:Secreted protein n=4 Tax=Mycobacteroides abscessus TaxID=36809 RepID=B1MM87_MYCA9|nr:hypothetical protein [Mycobacteroides abscessus]EUA63586.1 hypothetical protein I542_3743 [Mycobacteroides abscessus 1948]AKP61290.1 hypothetical protein MAUC22_25745 [Mycobacteroides abscessus UC22]ALM19723.1 hypothetical protein AOY11_24235 [Mycobacteroides abscessus]AMU48713.1 hypothetical protein A3O00_24100 [Mycobacteroides abscessus]AMU53754.1 hypothetical protein A3O01_24815 [Mycobacteroides abscessus]